MKLDQRVYPGHAPPYAPMPSRYLLVLLAAHAALASASLQRFEAWLDISDRTLAEQTAYKAKRQIMMSDDGVRPLGGRHTANHGPPIGIASITFNAVVMSAVVSGAVSAVFCGFLRRRRQQQQQQVDAADQQGQCAQKEPWLVMQDTADVVPQLQNEHQQTPPQQHSLNSSSPLTTARSLSRTINFQTDSADLPLRKLASERTDWVLHSSQTSPLVEDINDDAIYLGELIGCGSFGKVYKGSWAGRDVAVKIIEHTTANLPDVQQEAELLLSLHSPNIVNAYHYATYVHKQDAGKSRPRRNRSFRRTASFRQSTGRFTESTLSSTCASTVSSASSGDSKGCGSGGSAVNVYTASGISGRVAATLSLSRSASEAAPAVSPLVDTDVTAASYTAQVTPEKSNVAWRDQNVQSAGADTDTIKPLPAAAAGPQSLPAACKAETYLLLEYCDAGTLGTTADEWVTDPGCPHEDMLERLVLLKDVASGLEMLHSKNIVHADLNVRNVLVTSSEDAPTGLVAKLGDMGMSRVIKQQSTHRTTNAIGTLSHQPPEMLQYGRMSTATDIYALGVMMWELFTGQTAFRKLQYGQFFEAVVLHNLRPMVPKSMPADYRLLMESCWVSSALDRPSISRVVECLTAMIEERVVQLAAGEETAIQIPSTVAEAVSAPLPAVANNSKASRRRSVDVTSLMAQRELSMLSRPQRSSCSFIGRSSNSITTTPAPGSKVCISEPLPSVFPPGRTHSITSQRSSAFSMRQASDSWLLQRSPASFTMSGVSFSAGSSCFSESSFSRAMRAPLLVLGSGLQEDVFSMADVDVASDSEDVEKGGDIAAAAAVEEYFWVV